MIKQSVCSKSEASRDGLLIMEEVLNMNNELNSKKTMVLASLGMTKSGKTTGIAALTKYPDVLIGLSAGDSGRTKTTVQYHFLPEMEKAIQVEEIVLHEGKLIEDLKNDPKCLKQDSILKEFLEPEKLGENDNVTEYVREGIRKLETAELSNDQFKQLLCTEAIDQYVKRITLRVPAQEKFAEFLSDSEIDLNIRDTRGLLDIALESNDKNKIRMQSLSELGLEDLDGVLFFCSESYPNIIQDLYRDVFTTVFKSVPIFLIARDNLLYNIFKGNGKSMSYENVEFIVQAIREEKLGIYSDTEQQFFLNTFKLMENFEITKRNEEKQCYEFTDTYFEREKIEFLFPSSVSLKSCSKDTDFGEAVQEEDFKFYQMMAVISCMQMIGMICKLQENIGKVLTSGAASECLKKSSEEQGRRLWDDFNKYNFYHTSLNATKYVKPQFEEVSINRLETDIKDPTIPLLGERNGITTKDEDGSWKYPTTAVTAVTSKQWIFELISRITLQEDIKDPVTGEVLFPNLKGNVQAQKKLLKHALYNILYKQYIDSEAMIYYYLFVNRYRCCPSN